MPDGGREPFADDQSVHDPGASARHAEVVAIGVGPEDLTMSTTPSGSRLRRLSALLSLGLGVTLLTPVAAYAAPPSPSDRFGDAPSVSGVTTPGFAVTLDVDMSSATYPDEGGEAVPCGSVPARTVWLKFTATMSGRVTVTTTGSDVASPSVTGYLRPSSDGSMTRYPCGSGTTAIPASTGGTYYIQAADGGTGGNLLRLTIAYSSVTAYDHFSTPRGMSAVWHTDVVDLGAATSDPSESHPCDGTERTLWYRYVATTPGAITIDPTASTTLGTALAAYRDTGGGLAGLVPLGCSKGALTFNVGAGSTYYVQASDLAPGGGFLSVTWSFGPAADQNPPTIVGTPGDFARLTSNPDGVTVTYPMPAAFDDVDGSVPVACVPLTGSVFRVGVTAVTCTARDAVGNLATSTFNVRVERQSIVPPEIRIESYDVRLTPESGWWNYGHTYDGTVTSSGRVVQGGTYARPLLDYAGGNGTLDDGYTTPTIDNQLFSLHADVAGRPIAPVIVLHLDGVYDISGISLFGGDGTSSAEAGALSAVSVTIGGQTARVATTAFGTPSYFQPGNNDFVDLSGTTLSHAATNTIVLSGFEAALPFWVEPYQMFSIAEITVRGAPADVVPPALTLPADISAEATGPSGASVNYSVSAVDIVDGSVAVGCTWPSGITFPIGTTAVSCSSTDSAGNLATGSFTVSVRDTVAPILAYGLHPAVYSVADAVHISCMTADAVGVATSICAAIEGFGWEIGLGAHTYSATATDAAGNGGSASTAFTVIASYGSMKDLSRQWVSKAGIAKDLVAVLDAAAAAEARGQLSAEAGKLADYRSMVLAQAGKSITVARAAMLVEFSRGL